MGLGPWSPLTRSESAEKAIWPPEGDPPRRLGSLLQLRVEMLEHGDAGGAGTIAEGPTAAIAVGGTLIPPPDEGVNFTSIHIVSS